MLNDCIIVKEKQLKNKISENEKRREISQLLKEYSGKPDPYAGIALWIPEENEMFTVSFGTGDNLLAEDKQAGFDDYLYLCSYMGLTEEMIERIKTEEWDEIDWMDESERNNGVESDDGGDMMFCSMEAGYDYDITKAVYDALMMRYDTIPIIEPLRLYIH